MFVVNELYTLHTLHTHTRTHEMLLQPPPHGVDRGLKIKPFLTGIASARLCVKSRRMNDLVVDIVFICEILLKVVGTRGLNSIDKNGQQSRNFNRFLSDLSNTEHDACDRTFNTQFIANENVVISNRILLTRNLSFKM